MGFNQCTVIPFGPSGFGFGIFWSSTPAPNGSWMAAFRWHKDLSPTNGTVHRHLVPALTVASIMKGELIPPADRRMFGFLILHEEPNAAGVAAFASSVADIAKDFPPVASPSADRHYLSVNPRVLILWLDKLGSFTRESAFGFYLSRTKDEKVSYQLDADPHRLFDAGAGRVFAAIPSAGSAATLVAEDNNDMGVILEVARPGLPLSFIGNGLPDQAIVGRSLGIALDGDHAGCISIHGTIFPTSTTGWRNFELGFQHSLVPAPESAATTPTFRLVHPFFDITETLADATVRAVLDPLHRSDRTHNRLHIVPRSGSFVSAYRTRFAEAIWLHPDGGLFSAAAIEDQVYFAPEGKFELISMPGTSDTFEIIGGLSGVEYLTCAVNDTLSFVPGQPARILYSTAEAAGGSCMNFTLDGDTASTTSWATLIPTADRSFVSENEAGPFFRAASSPPANDTPLAYLPLTCAKLSAQSTKPAVAPLLPYAAFAGGAAADLAAAFEHGFVSPLRFQQLTGAAAAPTPTVGSAPGTEAVTPQGYIAALNAAGQMVSLTLGTIDPVQGRDGHLEFGAQLRFTGTGGGPLPAELTQAFLANQQFIVATSFPGEYQANATLSGWGFAVTPEAGTRVVPGAYQCVLIVKSIHGTLKQFAAQPAMWTAYNAFNAENARFDAAGAMLSQWLVEYLAAAEALYAGGTGGDEFETFVELVNDEDWNGYIYLNVPVPVGQLPPELQFLTAGMDATMLCAHHLGCAVNHTKVGTAGHYDAASSYFGLVHYIRAHAGAAALQPGGTPPFTPDSVTYDFQLLTLQVRFENSALVHFQSSAQLVLSELLGETISPNSPDPAVPATNAVLIFGSMQTANGVPHYAFATARDSSSTLFPVNAILTRIEIDRAVVRFEDDPDTDGRHVAEFLLAGWLGFTALSAVDAQTGVSTSFDLLSYAAIGFDGLKLRMHYDGAQLKFDPPDASAVVLSQLPERPLGLGEEVTAAAAAGNVIYRPDSLAGQFPLSVSSFVVGDATRAPTALGYRGLDTPKLPGALPADRLWYGLELDLPLGGGGALSDGGLLTAKLLLAWTPNGGGSTPPPFQPFFMLQGPGGANLTMSLEGVLKLGAESIRLVRTANAAATADPSSGGRFQLELASIGVSILGWSFPPRGTTNLVLEGIADGGDRALSWLGAYRSARGSQD